MYFCAIITMLSTSSNRIKQIWSTSTHWLQKKMANYGDSSHLFTLKNDRCKSMPRLLHTRLCLSVLSKLGVSHRFKKWTSNWKTIWASYLTMMNAQPYYILLLVNLFRFENSKTPHTLNTQNAFKSVQFEPYNIFSSFIEIIDKFGCNLTSTKAPV